MTDPNNRQWRLVSRPEGQALPVQLPVDRDARAAARGRPGPGPDRPPVARPDEPRLDQRDRHVPATPSNSATSCAASDSASSRSRGPPRCGPGQLVQGMTGWQSYVVTDGRGFSAFDPIPGVPMLGVPRAVRPHRRHGVLRPARHRQAAGGGDGRGLGGRGRRRLAGGTNRQDRRLPRGRHRGRPGQVPVDRRRTRVRRRHRLQARARPAAAARAVPAGHRRGRSRTSAATSSTPCSPISTCGAASSSAA